MPTKTGVSFDPANQPVTIPANRHPEGAVAALLPFAQPQTRSSSINKDLWLSRECGECAEP
jgi:hypothetical protein